MAEQLGSSAFHSFHGAGWGYFVSLLMHPNIPKSDPIRREQSAQKLTEIPLQNRCSSVKGIMSSHEC